VIDNRARESVALAFHGAHWQSTAAMQATIREGRLNRADWPLAKVAIVLKGRDYSTHEWS
jgi:hypothetical protein